MIGIIVNNIGSPDHPTPQAVDLYLREFLMDKNIIGAPKLIRKILVHCLIVPRRRVASAAKYKAIWTESGSPLTAITRRFATRLQSILGNDRFKVVVGSRYGHPSLEQALLELDRSQVEKIYLLPMYPQWAQATTGSAIEKFQELSRKHQISTSVFVLQPFFSDSRFIEILARNLDQKRKEFQPDMILFSYHGLPVSQLKKVKGCYQREDCCSLSVACDRNCYRAQCLRTSALIAHKLNLAENQWETGFQSRFGPVEWMGPATSQVVSMLAQRGIKKILIQTPSFTVDCLETLEEIGVELKQDFLKRGGEDLQLVPCLNDQDDWIRVFPDLMNQFLRLLEKRD